MCWVTKVRSQVVTQETQREKFWCQVWSTSQKHYRRRKTKAVTPGFHRVKAFVTPHHMASYHTGIVLEAVFYLYSVPQTRVSMVSHYKFTNIPLPTLFSPIVRFIINAEENLTCWFLTFCHRLRTDYTQPVLEQWWNFVDLWGFFVYRKKKVLRAL